MRRTEPATIGGPRPAGVTAARWPLVVGGAFVVAAATVAGALATGSWLAQVGAGVVVAVLAVAGCTFPLRHTRGEADRLRTTAEAEDRFVAALDSHDARTAMAAAVEVLVPHGRLVELHLTPLGPAPTATDVPVEGLSGVLVGDALATGRPAVLPDGTTGRETARLVALPIAAHGHRIGAAVLRLRGDSDAGLEDMRRLLRRTGPVLAAAGAGPDDAEAPVGAAEPPTGAGPSDAGAGAAAAAGPAAPAGTDAAPAADDNLRDLVARGAHDLRTPLNTLAGMVDTLVRHGDELAPSTREELHGALQRSTRRVAGWITMLLDAAVDQESRSSRPVLTALQPLLEEAATVTHAATAGLRVEVADTDLYVFADPSRVVRVVSNLLANAGHHAGAGDRVEVDARERGRDVEVSIRDNGAGWGTPEGGWDTDGGVHLSGLGLGLQSVREQVVGWGGELELDETPGGGATVRFTVPGARAGSAGGDAGSGDTDARGRTAEDGARGWTVAGSDSVVRGLHRTS